MALQRKTKHNEGLEEEYVVTERLYADAEGKLVAEDDPNVATLFATPGKQIPHSVAVELGLVKERKKAPANKQRKAASTKRRK